MVPIVSLALQMTVLLVAHKGDAGSVQRCYDLSCPICALGWQAIQIGRVWEMSALENSFTGCRAGLRVLS